MGAAALAVFRSCLRAEIVPLGLQLYTVRQTWRRIYDGTMAEGADLGIAMSRPN